MSLVEREEISRGLAGGCSLRSIAAGLGRCPSTVGREVARNGGARRYRATRAEDRAWTAGRRPKAAKLAVHGDLRAAVQDRLALRWSPQQIDSRSVSMTNKAQIATWVHDYGEDSDFVRVRVKGEFPRAGTMQFIDSERFTTISSGIPGCPLKRPPASEYGTRPSASVMRARRK